MKDFKQLYFRFQLILRVFIIFLGMILFYCFSQTTHNFLLWLFLSIALLVFYLFNQRMMKWYRKHLSDLFLNKIDIISYEQYIKKASQNRFAIKLEKGQANVTIIKAQFYYLLGRFDEALLELEKLTVLTKPLTMQQKKYPTIIRIKSKILIGKYHERYELFQDIETSPYLNDCDKEETIAICNAIFDIMIDKTTNDYFDRSVTSNNLEELEKLFYQAQNDLLKNHNQQAQHLFRIIVHNYDSSLYYVKEADKILKETL